ncbi:MAG: YgiQ family radical SAM protein, partial [Euryarchaeota archaeon]|nr:YgiQ family radical SAM protein [Euryarchaeota archaeon]
MLHHSFYPLPPLTADQPPFLPATEREQRALGIDQFDIILVSGDAYVDHPSFGTALLGRTLTGAGYSVGVISQPDISDRDSFLTLGTPRLFFSVSSGSVDSMVNHYTPGKKRRSDDAYSPGGKCLRPDRAVLVYTDLLHRTVPQVPIVIGGVEASLRRFAHYDYWSDKVRQSILADAPADLLVFGMGERPLLEIASLLSDNEKTRLPEPLYNIPGTVVKRSVKEFKAFLAGEIVSFFEECSTVLLPSFSEVSSDRHAFMQAEHLIITHQNPAQKIRTIQPHP